MVSSAGLSRHSKEYRVSWHSVSQPGSGCHSPDRYACSETGLRSLFDFAGTVLERLIIQNENHGKASPSGPTGGLSETLAFEKAHFKSLFCQKRPFSSYRAQLGPSRPNSADWPARARPRRRTPASVPGPRPGSRSPAGAPGPSQGPAWSPDPGPGPRSGAPWRTLKSGFRKKVPL